jgi:nucleotide-binding universal stress UspA family protein
MMPTPRTRRLRLILAAVDFSPQSARALRYAAALSRACGGRLVALHAVDPLVSTAAARAYSERALLRDTNDELVTFTRRTLGVQDADRVECAVVVGPARLAVMAESARRRPDVVVVGTNGRGGVAKIFFGSTTEALLRRYHGAVLVVPPHCPSPGEQWPHGSIIGAIGAGPHRRALVSAAARTAEMFGAWLTVTTPDTPVGRARWPVASLVVLPLRDSARLRTFAQGTSAYEFVRKMRVPVLVMHTGRRIGHVDAARSAA